ncbi:MAG TPA: ABC transporter ATP-binding protein [Verrucomicrobiae bacterium]|nr:ABC transporter ATP-binding protein [Verrucomicrobiae bacterium]
MQLDPVEIQFDGRRPWRTLFNLYWPERRAVVLAMLAYLFKASPLWILPVVTANIIDVIAYRSDGGLRSLWLNAAVGTVAIVQNIPSAMFYVNFSSRAIRNVELRLRSALVRRLQMLSIGYHNRVNTAALQTKVLRDVESIEQLSRQIIDTGELAIVSILFALVVTALRMPWFLPVFILFIPMIWAIRKFMAGRLQQHSENLRRELEGMNSLVQGMITMIPITRAHAAEEEEVARVENQFGNVRTAARSLDKIGGLFGAVGWVTLMLFNIAGLTLGAWLSYKGILPLTPGDLVLVAGFFNMIMTAVMQLNNMLPLITRGFDGLRSIGEVIECLDVEDNRGKKPVTQVHGEFVFEDVGFVYDQGGEAPAALRGINLTVRVGETIGIVGPSGSGKSTLANLITGFYRPTSGRILLDGADMNTIDLRKFRQRLSVVSQQTILFNGTLRENIVYGLRDVNDAELQAAVADANAAEFIRELPRGLDTEIGQSGVQLSGGQRQRIAIARALLRDPRVLILDEATSALDTESEAVVQEALEKLMAGRTTFIIAHRHAVLRRANQIFRLEKGQIQKTISPADLPAA